MNSDFEKQKSLTKYWLTLKHWDFETQIYWLTQKHLVIGMLIDLMKLMAMSHSEKYWPMGLKKYFLKLKPKCF